MIRRAVMVLAGFAIGFVTTARGADEPTPEDRKAVEALGAEFVRAFDAGDAAAVAATFARDATVRARGEPAIEGREAIQRRFAEQFAAEPGRKMVLKPESLRFLDDDAAVEEGVAVVTSPSDVPGAPGESVRSLYTVGYVREDGRWLQDSVIDHPEPEAAKSPRERLAALEWLVGEWVDEDDAARVHTTCEWADGGAFLVRKYRVESDRKEIMTGVQRIGWDPGLKQFRSWNFDSRGGYAEAVWSHDPSDDRWIAKSTGFLPDGRPSTATIIVIRPSRDLLLWTSADRTVGGRALPDSETITLARRPPKPTPDPTAPADAIKGTQP